MSRQWGTGITITAAVTVKMTCMEAVSVPLSFLGDFPQKDEVTGGHTPRPGVDGGWRPFVSLEFPLGWDI